MVDDAVGESGGPHFADLGAGDDEAHVARRRPGVSVDLAGDGGDVEAKVGFELDGGVLAPLVASAVVVGAQCLFDGEWG